ncbi:MAG: hypothetical protein K2G06_01500, partial [Muribaculaceae bacterium]|nr:hypothetical protein [Muribaculaceae bacterium]
MKNFIKTIMLLLFVMISIEAKCKDLDFLKSKIENKFSLNEKNLSGSVFSVVTYSACTKKEFGEESAGEYHAVDSIIFDENGKITERYYYEHLERRRAIYTYEGTDCKIMIQRIESQSNKWHTYEEQFYKREFDDLGRITSETMYRNNNPKTRINFSYTPTGYKVEYYKSLTSSPIRYEINNNTYKHDAIFAEGTYKFNNEEKPILYTCQHHNGLKINYTWKYNEQGDLVELKKQASSPYPGMGTESNEYQYDNNGNWISLVKTNIYGDKNWYKRNIT